MKNTLGKPAKPKPKSAEIIASISTAQKRAVVAKKKAQEAKSVFKRARKAHKLAKKAAKAARNEVKELKKALKSKKTAAARAKGVALRKSSAARKPARGKTTSPVPVVLPAPSVADGNVLGDTGAHQTEAPT